MSVSREISIYHARFYWMTPVLLDRLRRERGACAMTWPVRGSCSLGLFWPASVMTLSLWPPPPASRGDEGSTLSPARIALPGVERTAGGIWTAWEVFRDVLHVTVFLLAVWAGSPWLCDRVARWVPIAGLLVGPTEDSAADDCGSVMVTPTLRGGAVSLATTGHPCVTARPAIAEAALAERRENAEGGHRVPPWDLRREMHHILRMAAWNAPGWPASARGATWRPTLETVPEHAFWLLERVPADMRAVPRAEREGQRWRPTLPRLSETRETPARRLGATPGRASGDGRRWRSLLERVVEGCEEPCQRSTRVRGADEEEGGPATAGSSTPPASVICPPAVETGRDGQRSTPPPCECGGGAGRPLMPAALMRAIREVRHARPGGVARERASKAITTANRFAVLHERDGAPVEAEVGGGGEAGRSGWRGESSPPAIDEQSSAAPGRPPGSGGLSRRRRPQDQHGPRAPKWVADEEMWLMREVPRRRRTESQRVLEAHARFLQLIFRRTRSLARRRSARGGSGPGSAWRAGSMRGLLPIWRPVCRTQCTDGIASPADFDAQRRRAGRVLAWYRQYGELLRKLMGRAPEVVDLFCGQGGSSEGIRRAGLAPVGLDMSAQPQYSNRFGAERFTQGDAYLPSAVREKFERHRAVGVSASPPCQPYSTVLADGATATAAPGIPQAAALIRELGCPFWVENVLGADAEALPEKLTILRGQMFGLQVDRGRRFWTNFDVHVDAALAEGGLKLRQRSCLGPRRRWLRLDPLGRPMRRPCCAGNLFPVQGRRPTRSSLEENAHAMGVDEGHMTWPGLAQSIPPAMAQLL